MMQNRLRRNVAALLTSAALLVGVTACGTETGETGPRANPNPSVKPEKPAPVEGPVELTRTGGFAGVNETVTVDLDGKATVTSGKNSFTCTVDAATLASLEEEAGILEANGVENKVKKSDRDRPESDTQIVDAFNYTLTVDGQEFAYSGGETIPRNVRPLLAAMSEVLSSAVDVQKGNGSADGTVECAS